MSIVENTGRRTQISANFCIGSEPVQSPMSNVQCPTVGLPDWGLWTVDFGLLLLYRHSIRQLFDVTGGNLFIAGNAVLDLDQIAFSLSQLDHPFLSMAVLNYKNPADACFGAHCTSRHQHGWLRARLQDPDCRKLSR